MSHAQSIRLAAFVSCCELTESTELKKAAEADLHDAAQTPFSRPRPAPPQARQNALGTRLQPPHAQRAHQLPKSWR